MKCWGENPKLLYLAPTFNLVADVRWIWPQLITLITGIALATAFTPSDFMHTNPHRAMRHELTWINISPAEFEHLQARVGSGGGKGAPVDSGIR